MEKVPSSPLNNSRMRPRSWLELSSPVSITTSARPRNTSSSRRSSVIDSSTPRAASGWRRRVSSKRRIRTSSGASRNRTVTRCRALASDSSTGSTSSCCSPPPRPMTSATRSVSDPGTPTSSATLGTSDDGRLSMTNQPMSSKVAAAVERPAPDIPATTRNSLIACLVWPNRSRATRSLRGERPGPGGGSAAQVQLAEDRVGDRGRQPPERAQLLERGAAQRLEAPHVGEQPLTAGRAETGNPLQRARRHALTPSFPVEGDGEAVGLVADPLQEVEGLGAARDADGVAQARAEHLFELLGQRRQLDLAGEAQLVEDPDPDPELSLAAVQHEQLG